MDRESGTVADKHQGSRQIADKLRQAILDGKYAHSRFPSYRELTSQHGVALNTAQAAVRQLENEGYVVVSQGKRAEVRERTTPMSADEQLAQLRAELLDVRDAMRDAGTVVAALEKRMSQILDHIQLIKN